MRVLSVSLYVLGCTGTYFTIEARFMKRASRLLKRTLSSLIIPVNVTNFTIELAKCTHWYHWYFCFTLHLPCTLKMAG